MEAKLAIVFADFFGPGSLCAPPVVEEGSKEGNCFGLGGLRAPPKVADGSESGHCFH